MNCAELQWQPAPYMHLVLSPDFGRGFLLSKDDICNIGEVVVFSETVEKGSTLKRFFH